MTFAETFLEEPAWFPTAEPPAASGGHRLLLAMPGGPFRLHGLHAPEAAALRSRFGSYEEHGGAPNGAVEVRVLRCDPRRFRRFDTRGWEYTLDLDFGPSGLRIAGLGLLAELEPDRSTDNWLWTAATDPAAVAGDCENVLRVLCACRLLAEGAVMIHGAGVAAGAVGAVAAGHSGAGKTTFSRLAAAGGAGVLSDDLVALRPGRGEVWVEQLPFGGDLWPSLDRRPSVALAALLGLEHSATEELVPMRAAEAVGLLLACSPVVNVDPQRRDRLLDVLHGIVAAVPPEGLRRLRFRRNGNAWRLVSSLLVHSPRADRAIIQEGNA
jgi:hypothetical protein